MPKNKFRQTEVELGQAQVIAKVGYNLNNHLHENKYS